MISTAINRWGFPCCVWPPMPACRRHYPGRFNGACSLVYLHCQRPSLCNSQVGSCTCSFGACSAFTHVTACTLAESPSDSLHRKLRQLRCLHCRFDCYRVERTSSRAGVAPAEVQRLSRRTVTSTTGEPLSFRIATIHELAWLAHTRAFVDTDLQCHLLDQKTKDSQYAVTCSSIAGASRRS